jgi:hypothetical protein
MTPPFAEGPLRDAMRHLFNSDPDAAHASIARHLSEAPSDPLAHAISAAVSFYHYVSLHVEERDAPTVISVLLGSGVAMPRPLQKEIGTVLRRVQTMAAESPENLSSLLALCITESINRDGLALVSKRWQPALAHARRAHAMARALIDRDPSAHDADFVFGFTEYLVSRVPSALREFARIPGVAGDRRKAIVHCRVAAASGWYFQEFARRTLVNLYVDEGRQPEALTILGGLVEEFPGSALLRLDWEKLRREIAGRDGGRKI